MIVEGEDSQNEIDIERLSSMAVAEENSVQKTTIPIFIQFPNNLSTSKESQKGITKEILFRNYLPLNENFHVEKLPYYDIITSVEKHYEKKVRKNVKDFINLEKNPLNIVPKKNNMDLKRNLAEKLERLNKRTEIAILELIRENIKSQQLNVPESREGEGGRDFGSKMVMTSEIQMKKDLDELNMPFEEDEEKEDIGNEEQ